MLILDEPTQGVDVGSKAEIHALMGRLAERGVAIVMISSEMPEILGMSDRIAVMQAGRLAGTLARAPSARRTRFLRWRSAEVTSSNRTLIVQSRTGAGPAARPPEFPGGLSAFDVNSATNLAPFAVLAPVYSRFVGPKGLSLCETG